MASILDLLGETTQTTAGTATLYTAGSNKSARVWMYFFNESTGASVAYVDILVGSPGNERTISITSPGNGEEIWTGYPWDETNFAKLSVGGIHKSVGEDLDGNPATDAGRVGQAWKYNWYINTGDTVRQILAGGSDDNLCQAWGVEDDDTGTATGEILGESTATSAATITLYTVPSSHGARVQLQVFEEGGGSASVLIYLIGSPGTERTIAIGQADTNTDSFTGVLWDASNDRIYDSDIGVQETTGLNLDGSQNVDTGFVVCPLPGTYFLADGDTVQQVITADLTDCLVQVHGVEEDA